jgi:hypothetical protein
MRVLQRTDSCGCPCLTDPPTNHHPTVPPDGHMTTDGVGLAPCPDNSSSNTAGTLRGNLHGPAQPQPSQAVCHSVYTMNACTAAICTSFTKCAAPPAVAAMYRTVHVRNCVACKRTRAAHMFVFSTSSQPSTLKHMRDWKETVLESGATLSGK